MGILRIVVSVNYSRVNYIKTYLLGDVNFEKTKDLCSYITPVPGGYRTNDYSYVNAKYTKSL